MGAIRVGRVTGRKVSKNRDGGGNVMLLQVEISDPDDIQTAELMDAAGEMTNPPDDSRVVVVSVGAAFKIAVATNDGVENDLEPGEKQVHATSGGAVKAYARFKKDGTLILNGEGDFAVRFSKLEEAFNQLQSEYDDLATKWNTFALAYAPGGPTAQGTPPAAQQANTSTADISGAKIDTIKVPA